MIKLQLSPEPKVLKQFTWVALFAFPLIALLFKAQFGLPSPWYWVIGALGPIALAGQLAGVRPVPLLIFRFLVLVTWPIGMIVFPLVIGLVYYGVFTPMGLVMRLMGRDVLHRKPDPNAKTYWHDKGEPRPASSYFKLY